MVFIVVRKPNHVVFRPLELTLENLKFGDANQETLRMLLSKINGQLLKLIVSDC